MQPLYPYYLVTEAKSFDDLTFTGDFREGDTMNPAVNQTEFAAYTDQDRLMIRTRCYNTDLELEGIRLNFDPDHSGRRPHNLVQISVDGNGNVKAETMEYDIIHLTPVDGVKGHSTFVDGLWECTLDIPLNLVYKIDQGRRYIGLNVIRGIGGKTARASSKWSGLPGEIAVQCLQGVGDLLFVKDLDTEEIDALVKKSVADSHNYYTKWEKQKLPAEMLNLTRAKKSGLSLRLKQEDLERARFHAQHTEWGAKIAERTIEAANYWALKSDQELFDFIIPGNPRAMTPSQFFGDPLTGGNRSTLKTCIETPFRFYNEETGEWWYPGKRLTNPMTGEEVVVEDDGSGFLLPEGFANPYTRCMLVAAYRQYRLGIAMAAPYCPTITDRNVVPETTGLKYSGAIPNLANAYSLTGDILYAYKAAILIGRIAELYPYMNGGYHDGSYSDTVHIAEPSTTGTEWKKNLLQAYDLIFDDIDLFHDELKALFASQPDAENKQRELPFDLRRAVEQEMIPYIIYSCELERSGASDWSMRLLELEVETAALIQNGELLNNILIDSKFSLFSKLKNGYYRDGKYAYDSSEYVEMMSVAMMNYPNWAYLFQDDDYFKEPLNLFEDSRFGVKEAIAVYYKFRNGSLSASFGDTTVDNLLPISERRKRGLSPYLWLSETVFRRMPSARSFLGPALALYTSDELNAMRVEACMHSGRGVESSLLLLANALSEEELAPYRVEQNVVQPPYLLEDSEISMLRMGTSTRNTKHVVLYGQPTLPHCHGDKLGLWIGAYGIHMLAHGGHYPYIWIGPKITQWELHSASCNVVLIDGRNQAPSSSIQLEHYEGTFIQIAGMENREAYPGSHYERWTWLIQAPDGENAYTLDQFHVSNGARFDYNTHGLDVQIDDIAFEGVHEWTSRAGTLAGENVPLYGEPGYGWMRDVRIAKVEGNISWTYPYGGNGLKITALNDKPRELIACLGEKGGQEMKKSAWDSFVLLRDEAAEAEQHKTSFTTIMEPFEGKPFLQSITRMERIEEGDELTNGDKGRECYDEFPPVGICVNHPNGVRDILISVYENGRAASFRDETGVIHTTDADALFLRYKGEQLVKAEALSFTIAASGVWRQERSQRNWRGTVVHVEAEQRQITIQLNGECPDLKQLKDCVGFIDAEAYKKASPYYIREPQLENDLLTFQVDITLFRGEEGWQGAEKARVQQGKSTQGYAGKKMIMDVKTGDSFTLRNRFVLSN